MDKLTTDGRCPGCGAVFRVCERFVVVAGLRLAHEHCQILGNVFERHQVPPGTIVFVNDNGEEVGRITDLLMEKLDRAQDRG